MEDFRLPLTPSGEYPDGGRVRLRGDRTEVYQLARAGAEGWVRDRRYDPLDPGGGIRMVEIEWDRDHWGYNGQEDTWSFEDHFEPARETGMSEDKSNDIRAALQVIAGALGVGEETPPTGNLREAPEDGSLNDEEYLTILKSAMAAARDGDSFLLITVDADQAPKIFKGDKTEVASLLVAGHAANVAALLHREHIRETLSVLHDDGPDPLAA